MTTDTESTDLIGLIFPLLFNRQGIGGSLDHFCHLDALGANMDLGHAESWV